MGILDRSSKMVRPLGRRANMVANNTKTQHHPNAPVTILRWLVMAPVIFIRHHRRALIRGVLYVRYELGQFLPACAGLGLILALPLLLYVAMLNMESLSTRWHSGSGVSAYLHAGGDQDSEMAFVERLRVRADVGKVIYRSNKTALEEFRDWSGLAHVLDGLDRNPLPAVLEVYHRKTNPDPKEIELLRLDLDAMPEVSVARADISWLSEYYQLNTLFWRALLATIIVALSGTAFAVAFSIRLMVINRREEIRVTRLMGGNKSYIARPFMYIGFCYGVFSMLLACLLVSVCRLWLDQPIGRLVDLYGSDFQLLGLGWKFGTQLLLYGGLLGILGARVAVGIQLKILERQLKY